MSHVSKGGEELGTVYARFIKDRAEIEREYAKNMRKLVNKYSDKTNENKKSKESTQAKGFRYAFKMIKKKTNFMLISLILTILTFGPDW